MLVSSKHGRGGLRVALPYIYLDVVYYVVNGGDKVS